MEPRDRLSLAEAARRLGVSTATLRGWVGEGLVQSETGTGSRLVFSEREIERARSALGFSTAGHRAT